MNPIFATVIRRALVAEYEDAVATVVRRAQP